MKGLIRPQTASALNVSLGLMVLCGCLAPRTVVAEGQSVADLLNASRLAPPPAIQLPEALSNAVPFATFGSGMMIRGSITPDRRDQAPGTITLNLLGIPVQQAAQTVLGEILRVNYVVDPRLNGTVTLQTSRPISKTAALELFQAAIQPIGATVVHVDNIFKIVPVDQAATGSITTGRGAVPALDGTAYRIVPLRYVAASEIARILEPIVPRGTVVEADDARSIIAVRGSASVLQSVLDTIQSFDVDIMRGMSFGIVPVRSRQPARMVEDLKSIFASDRDGPLKGRVRFIANASLGAILVVSAQPSYLALAQDWIRRLDAQRQGSEPEVHIYVVQNRPARELAKVLQAMFGSQSDGDGDAALGGTLVSPRAGVSSLNVPATGSLNGSGASGTAAFGNGDGPSGSSGAPSAAPITATAFGSATPFRASDPNASAVGGSGPSLSAARGSGSTDTAASTTAIDQPRLRIVADDVKNSLVIMADAADYRRIVKAVKGMDVAASQVMIQAAVAEVTLNDQLQYGVQWQLQNSAAATPAASGTSTTSTVASTAAAVASAAPGFNYMLKLGSVTSTLTALNAITRVNVISTPSLMVMDNKTAALQIGDQVPVTTQTATSTITTNSAIVNSVEMRDTGVILSVTPRINESGRIQLDIEQEVSAVVKTTTSGIDSPTIQQRRVKTTVIVNDGEVLALGGMIQNKIEKDDSAVPLLGNIPVIGAAFASRGHSIIKTELIILISPRIVRNTREAREVTADARREVHAYQPPEPSQSSMTNTVRRLTEHP